MVELSISQYLRSRIVSVSHLCLVALLSAVPIWPMAAQTQPTNAQPETRASAVQSVQLSPEAAQVADQIGVALLLKRLEGLRGGSAADGSSTMLESLTVRQEITERVLSTSLEIDSVNAIIDSEIEQIRGIRADLQAQSDKAQNVINIASIVTGGVAGAITSALQFKPSTVNLGNGIGVAGGAGSVLLSLIGIHKQGGGRRSLGDSPRMLARFFGRQPGATEAIPSIYPEEVWSYLNSAPPSQPNTTRREQLIAKWTREGRIKQDGSAKGEGRIENMSTNISQLRKLNINDLNDRMVMLLDVRARVSLMKRGLSEILRGLSAPR
jgi:hypothetical protein